MTRGSSEPTDVLVGREAELARLTGAWDDARAGHGRLVVITGPAGIGKTRLTEEVAAAAAAAGAGTIWGRCTDEPGAPPLWPWLRLLAALGADATAVDDAMALQPTNATEGASARFRLVTAASEAVLRAPGANGTVLVLEDAHWADDTSLRVLRQVAADVSTSPVLLIVTARDAETSDRTRRDVMTDTLADLLRQRGVSALPLGRLPPSEVVAYLQAVAGQPLSQDLLRELHLRTGGLPLLVRAAATVLVDAAREGLPLDAEAGSELWRRMADGTDVRRLVATSTATLAPAAREMIVTASLLGEDVDPALLTAVLGVEPGDVLRHLDAAVSAHLLVPISGSPPGYRFGHALVRDAVAATVAPTTAASIHRRAAIALDTGTSADVDAGRTARAAGHWLRAGTDPATAARAALSARAAARAASRRFAHAEAAELLVQALEAHGRAGDDAATRAEVALELAHERFLSGGVHAAVAASEAAFDLAEQAGRPDLAASAALVVQGVGGPTVVEAVHRLTEAALRHDGLPAAVAARLHAQRASAYVELERFDEVGPESLRALELAQASDDDRAVLDAAWARAAALVTAGDVSERLGIGALAVERARRADQPILEIYGHLWRVDAQFALGNMPEVDREIAAVAALAARQSLPIARWHALRLRATRLAFVGEFERGFAASDEAGRLALDVLGDPSAAGLSWAHLAMINILRGISTSPPPDMVRALEQAPPAFIMRLSQAEALLVDRPDEARALYEQQVSHLEDGVRDGRWAGSLQILTHLADVFGDEANAPRLHDLMLPWTAYQGSWGTGTVAQIGSPHRNAAQMAALAGRVAQAEEHYRRAIAIDASMGALPSAAAGRVGLAELLARGAPAGASGSARRAEAEGLARLAAVDARRFGMAGVLERCDRLLPRAGAGPSGERGAGDPLTPREREIAALVAESMSNREIADQLVLSERTVESHVRNILAKLGFTGRTQIIRWSLSRPGPS